MACPINLEKCDSYCNEKQVYPAMRYFVREKGLGIREASREVEKLTGGLVKASRADKVYRDRTATNVAPKPPPGDTCTISDLYKLIDAGKKFGTIYADPPWKYSNQSTRAATDNHYKTLTPKEIAKYPIEKLADDKAHLHLWTTNAFLFECPAILEAWGFEYKGVFLWVKPQMGIGNYWRVSHEFLILGVRGGLTFYDKSQMSWLNAERTKHSTKPEIIAATIELVSPGPYLELFGRRIRKGWTVWGNEIKKELFNAAAFN